ncbi:MAG: class I SAM-dependent methyltransferase [Gammaproteobacteria bacterium]|nr:class I SAM-dependent methyltransferase [Gammaproteobacteria bacterium]
MTDPSDKQLLERVRGCFSRSAPAHRAHARIQAGIGEALVDLLCAHAPGQAEANVIEIGCGQAPLLTPYSQRASVRTAIGLDIAATLLQQARAAADTPGHAATLRPEMTAWVQADAHHLPVLDSCADVIICSMALHWCAQAPQALAEMHRAMKPGAWLALAIPVFPTLARLNKRLSDLGISNALNTFWPARQWQDLFTLDVAVFEYLHCPFDCADTPAALAHIRGVGANCLWRQSELGLAPSLPARLSSAPSQWRRARQQALWAQPLELCYHIGLWLLRKEEPSSAQPYTQSAAHSHRAYDGP